MRAISDYVIFEMATFLGLAASGLSRRRHVQIYKDKTIRWAGLISYACAVAISTNTSCSTETDVHNTYNHSLGDKFSLFILTAKMVLYVHIHNSKSWSRGVAMHDCA